ncbi:MAG: hypothetical protein EAX96_17710 [Candidatus Lokiarchaeota archaeon]|nr:hypothetical protein [Candidatus Lokiarchaeota archaeon]
MVEEKERVLTMCWFGVRQPLATSVVHVPEYEISPKELEEGPLIFIWDKFMKAPNIIELLGESIPWSPALIDGFKRVWKEIKSGILNPELQKNVGGRCLGAVLLTSRLSDEQLKPLIKDYENRGYVLKEVDGLIGDLTRKILAFLPK